MTGWTGYILHIDLTEESITRLPTKEYASRFLGGLGIGEKLYWDESSPDSDALHPDNPLIFMTGPLTASGTPAASRLVVCGKSPALYPETFASGNLGGFFPTQLKKAGFDGVVIRGKAARPCYLYIENGEVALRDASALWGLGNRATRQAIKDQAGTKASILSIGPGGENSTRIGVIFSDLASTAALGFGSVMGSKNLKAIVAVGTQSIPVADSDRVTRIRKKIKAMRGDGFFNLFGKPSTFPGTEIVKKTPCAGCPQGCWRTLQKIESGESEVRKCQVGMFYVLWDMRYHGKPTDTSFKSAIVANDHGLCVHELIFGLLWLEACIDQGILTDNEVGLPVSELGSFDFIERLIKMICAKEGIGKALAEGALRPAHKYAGN
jgi:aldehyde:ferredoxin oxidoreductase